ncbi:hypothetical protein V499_05147 [Pseudogymnoascus sp. VKM F-103]|nr:hypothetical protein V499_05147 [Pseudogymnoascus sp. VKM F-103]
MSRHNENESRIFVANSPTIAETPTGDDTITRSRNQESRRSTQTSDQDSPLYISPKKARRRQQRQSLSAISNKSIITNDDAEIHSRVANRLNREKLAWETINSEILEWQTVCRTGRPSWWSPTSRWTSQRRVRSRTSRDVADMGTADFGDNWPAPTQRFQQQKHMKGTSDTQEQAFITAVQLLSVSFTLPVEQFENSKSSTNLYFATASDGVPDARLISSLRMHTDYRWSPAFGHEARSTSPEYLFKATHGGEQPLAGLGDAPVSLDLSYSGRSRRSKRKRKRQRIRYVTPANRSGQEHVEKFDGHRSIPALESSALDSAEGGFSDSTQQTRSHLMPGRKAHSCPVSPTLTTEPVSRGTRLHHLPTQIEIDEPPVQTPQARWQLESSRYTLEPAIRTEPHPVFIQPVKELVVKSWQTFRKKLDNTLSRGCPDPGGTSAPFKNEQMSMSWPALAGPSASSWAVQRRRNARERHDIYSSSVESSPRYNSLTSGTTSDASSQIPADPTATMSVSRGSSSLAEVVNATKAKSPPASSNHSIPSFISNSTSDADSESSNPRPLPRSPAGFFIGKSGGSGPNHTMPSFVPLRGNKRRAYDGGQWERRDDLYLAGDSQNMHGPVEGHEEDMSRSRLQRISSAGTTVITPSDDSIELAALTRPRAEDDHEHRAADLQGPPEPVAREAVGVERDEDEVHDVQGYDEVEDEFGALDYEEDRYYTVQPEWRAHHQRRKQDHYHGADVVQRLQRQDLGEDAQRRELGQGAGARGAPSPWERHASTSAGMHVSSVDDVVGETKLLIGKLDLGDDYSIPITQDIVIEQQGNYALSTRPDRPATPSSHTKTTKIQGTEKSGLSTTATPATSSSSPNTHTMGLFSSSADKLPAPKISTDGTPIAPDRTARAKCWEARDAYFQCLDKNTIIDSLTNKDAAEKACGAENKGFEKNCASSWVTYFKKRRVMEYQRDQQMKKLRAEGAQEIPAGSVPPGIGSIPTAGPR